MSCQTQLWRHQGPAQPLSPNQGPSQHTHKSRAHVFRLVRRRLPRRPSSLCVRPTRLGKHRRAREHPVCVRPSGHARRPTPARRNSDEATPATLDDETIYDQMSDPSWTLRRPREPPITQTSRFHPHHTDPVSRYQQTEHNFEPNPTTNIEHSHPHRPQRTTETRNTQHPLSRSETFSPTPLTFYPNFQPDSHPRQQKDQKTNILRLPRQIAGIARTRSNDIEQSGERPADSRLGSDLPFIDVVVAMPVPR